MLSRIRRQRHPRACPENATTGTTTENLCERFFWTLADTNFNIVGVVTNAGQLVERYEYTPYGQRTVYSHGWVLSDLNGDGAIDTIDSGLLGDAIGSGSTDPLFDLNGDGVVDGLDIGAYSSYADAAGEHGNDPLVSYPRLASFRTVDHWTNLSHTPLCEFGHQGKMHDERIGLKENAARVYNPRLGRWMQRDPLGYVDGMLVYAYERLNPVANLDPHGLLTTGLAKGILSDFLQSYAGQIRRLGDPDPNRCEHNMLALLGGNEYDESFWKLGMGVIFAPLNAVAPGFWSKLGTKATEALLNGIRNGLTEDDIVAHIQGMVEDIAPKELRGFVRLLKNTLQNEISDHLGDGRVFTRGYDTHNTGGTKLRCLFYVSAETDSSFLKGEWVEKWRISGWCQFTCEEDETNPHCNCPCGTAGSFAVTASDSTDDDKEMSVSYTKMR